MLETSYDRKAVGRRIRERRLALHLTQESVAEKICKSTHTVTEIERGMMGMTIGTLLDFCKVLKTTPNDLLLPESPSHPDILDWLLQRLDSIAQSALEESIVIVQTYLNNHRQ